VLHVLIDIHFKQFQQKRNNLNNNQVGPQIEIDQVEQKSLQRY
jgi:hypothetical protein